MMFGLSGLLDRPSERLSVVTRASAWVHVHIILLQTFSSQE